jgi:hypothetical protein
LVDAGREEILQSVQHAEGGGVPQLVDSGAAGRQQASDVPAAVADRVVEGRPDRSTGRLEIGAAVDQC